MDRVTVPPPHGAGQASQCSIQTPALRPAPPCAGRTCLISVVCKATRGYIRSTCTEVAPSTSAHSAHVGACELCECRSTVHISSPYTYTIPQRGCSDAEVLLRGARAVRRTQLSSSRSTANGGVSTRRSEVRRPHIHSQKYVRLLAVVSTQCNRSTREHELNGIWIPKTNSDAF